MTIQVLRPNVDWFNGSEVLFSTGSTAWSLLDDGGPVLDFNGADDTTYVRVTSPLGGFTKGRIIVGLTNLPTPLTASQRIKQVRLRGRVRMHGSVPGFGATVTATFRDPQAGLGRGGEVTAQADAPRDEWFTSNPSTFQAKTGAWRTDPPSLDGSEWTAAIVNRGQIECVWYPSESDGANTNLRLSELYLDVDVRDQPTVSGVTVSGIGATTRPTVSWTYNPNADGDRQVQFRVKVFTAAQYSAAGFDPETSLATWDSGNKSSPTTSYDLGADLANGATYKIYVKAGQDFNRAVWYSPWAASAVFTVAVTPPPAPILAVTSDPTVPNLRNQLQYTATLNALAADDADFEVTVGNWIVGGALTSAARSTTQARNGVGSLALTSTGGATPFAANTGNSRAGAVAARPGQQFTLGGYVRANTTGRAWRLVARYHSFDGTTETYVSQANGTTVTDTSGAWTALPALTVTVPANVNLLYIQVESTATPAVTEIHYFDQFQVVPGGSLPAWAPGFLATSTAVVERAVATTQVRNMASRQLYGGGDDTRDASGFYTTGTTSVVTFDMLDRYRGMGSIRWEVEDTTSKLYLGWPSTTLADPAPRYALAAVPGRTYTLSLYARGTTPFSSRLNLQAIDAAGNLVGAAASSGPVTIGSAWQRISAALEVPAGATYVRPHLDNTGAVTGRRVWVDAVQWELGATPTDLTRPGGLPLSWVPVRGFVPGKTAVPGGTQSLVAFDHEVPPGATVIYRAWVYALDPTSGQALSSPPTAYFPTLIDPPGGGQWVLSEVAGAPFLRGRVNVLPDISESQHEEVTAYYPIRPAEVGQVGQRPVHLSDYIGGHDGTVQLAALSDDDWWLLEQLLAIRDSLWFTESQGGGRYIRLTGRAWTRVRFRDKCVNLADGTVLQSEEWERVLTLAYDHAASPPDNEAAVLFGVDPVTSGGGAEPPPPPPTPTTLANTFEGGTVGDDITAGNSGGTSGAAFTTVVAEP